LCQEWIELDAAMTRRVRSEATQRFSELALGSDSPSPSRLVPRDGDMDESLEEVSLVRRRRAPGILELLVRCEVLAGPDQLEALPKVSVCRRR
jgi:hypothetical protein